MIVCFAHLYDRLSFDFIVQSNLNYTFYILTKTSFAFVHLLILP